jgi:hypothetical protein
MKRSSRLKILTGVFFWQQNEGGTSVGWYTFGGNQSHLLEKGLCHLKKKH